MGGGEGRKALRQQPGHPAAARRAVPAINVSRVVRAVGSRRWCARAGCASRRLAIQRCGRGEGGVPALGGSLRASAPSSGLDEWSNPGKKSAAGTAARALQVAQRGAAYGLGWRRPEAPEGASGAPRGESTKAGPIGGRGGAPSPPTTKGSAAHTAQGLSTMLTKFETKSNRVKGLSFHPSRPWVLCRCAPAPVPTASLRFVLVLHGARAS